MLGTFSGAVSNVFVPDKSVGRAYYLIRDADTSVWTIKAYDINTFTPVGSLPIPNVSYPTSLVRWGANGLAFLNAGDELIVIQTSLIPSTEPVPTPTPTSPTPAASQLPFQTFVRRINTPANDLVYSRATQAIYASVPGVAGAGVGNTITKINTLTGAADSSVFIGSEPTKLALADDDQTLHVRLEGANGFRQYNVAAGTPGLQFSPGGSYNFRDMEAVPGRPLSFAVVTGDYGVTVYDNGVRRPNVSTGMSSVDTIEFPDSPNTLYAADNHSSGFDLVKFAVDDDGVSVMNSVRHINTGYNATMKFAGGLLYTSSGRVFEPEGAILRGTFSTFGSAMTVDAALKRAFFLNNNVLTAYDTDTFLKIGSVTLPEFPGTPTSLIRWGANGLAFRTSNTLGAGASDSQIFLIQSSLISAAPMQTGLNLSATAYAGNESNPGLTAAVTRTGDLSAASSVSYATSDGTATAGSDYTAVSGTLNFAAGESNKTITVPIINDNLFEDGFPAGRETFNLTLGNPTSNTALTYPSTAVLTIVDNDPEPYFVQNNSVAVGEPPVGGGSTVTFPVTLSNPSIRTITVGYATADGTATAGSDYLAASGTLTFNPLETSKVVTVTIYGDEINEPDENFTLRLNKPVNASVSGFPAFATILNRSPQTPYDFDGDARADVSVFRPDNGTWYLLQSAGGLTGFQFGLGSDKLVAADYDGDRKTDIAVYRGGTWYLQRSQFGFVGINFGDAGDIPQPADFDGDRKAELAVYRPSNGTWYIFNLATNQISYVQFGTGGDEPVAADYDGDGRADVAVFRPSNGAWYLQRSNLGFTATAFGEATDTAVPADYDGDGKTDVAVFRQSSGTWYLQRSRLGFTGVRFGEGTDLPVPADYDGDGRADVSVFRPSNGTWYLQRSRAGFAGVAFGASDDKPVPNAFVP